MTDGGFTIWFTGLSGGGKSTLAQGNSAGGHLLKVGRDARDLLKGYVKIGRWE